MSLPSPQPSLSEASASAAYGHGFGASGSGEASSSSSPNTNRFNLSLDEAMASASVASSSSVGSSSARASPSVARESIPLRLAGSNSAPIYQFKAEHEHDYRDNYSDNSDYIHEVPNVGSFNNANDGDNVDAENNNENNEQNDEDNENEDNEVIEAPDVDEPEHDNHDDEDENNGNNDNNNNNADSNNNNNNNDNFDDNNNNDNDYHDYNDNNEYEPANQFESGPSTEQLSTDLFASNNIEQLLEEDNSDANIAVPYWSLPPPPAQPRGDGEEVPPAQSAANLFGDIEENPNGEDVVIVEDINFDIAPSAAPSQGIFSDSTEAFLAQNYSTQSSSSIPHYSESGDSLARGYEELHYQQFQLQQEVSNVDTTQSLSYDSEGNSA